jgi:predicted dehydrogenase
MARGFVAEHFGAPTCIDTKSLLDRPLDAVLVAAPDFAHGDAVLAALERGLHVFCEKPLCYGTAEIDRILAARDSAKRIVQVGYMKRFDLSYEAALDELPADGTGLRYVSVEVHDPDAWPFVDHHPHRRSQDIPIALIEEGRAAQRRQIDAAVGLALAGDDYQGFASAYCSSLVHDVNAVHGLLDRLAVPDGEVVGAQLFAKGDGGLGTVRLFGGAAVWNMVHLTVPKLAEYRERITFYFDDWLLELEFPSPWLNHQPTRLTVQRSSGLTLRTTAIRPGFQEAYIRELAGFWSSIVEGAPVRNTVEHARRDQALLCALARHAVRDGGPQRPASG